jgi:hypothetical protein
MEGLIDVSRRAYPGKAIYITSVNLEAVAEWCGGSLVNAHLTRPGDIRCIEIVRRHPGGSVKNRQFAFVGQWIVQANNQFTVYKHTSFMSTFERTERKEALKAAFERGRVIAVLVGMLSVEMNTVEEITACAYENADKIMQVFGGEK